ncbi:methylthioribose kinase [Metabacillus litoralis]|uniref:DUF7147 family protein n=1 Tax=Metabacillus litoralis TaxID=152268 RepID=UPI001CFCED75|nr:methylthioribose kinase [Metabacillus litoralis]
MIQRFIELGEGYSDIYELLETAKANKHRISKLIALHTKINNNDITSIVVVMQPTTIGDFQALYMCREGLPNPTQKANKRYDLFEELATYLQMNIISLDVKPSTIFNEKELYHQYLIGILRLNHIIPPMR